MFANSSISFDVGIQALTASSTVEVELVAAALTMKESVFCKRYDGGTSMTDSRRSSVNDKIRRLLE